MGPPSRLVLGAVDADDAPFAALLMPVEGDEVDDAANDAANVDVANGEDEAVRDLVTLLEAEFANVAVFDDSRAAEDVAETRALEGDAVANTELGVAVAVGTHPGDADGRTCCTQLVGT
jgi:hypothetical protein